MLRHHLTLGLCPVWLGCPNRDFSIGTSEPQSLHPKIKLRRNSSSDRPRTCVTMSCCVTVADGHTKAIQPAPILDDSSHGWATVDGQTLGPRVNPLVLLTTRYRQTNQWVRLCPAGGVARQRGRFPRWCGIEVHRGPLAGSVSIPRYFSSRTRADLSRLRSWIRRRYQFHKSESPASLGPIFDSWKVFGSVGSKPASHSCCGYSRRRPSATAWRSAGSPKSTKKRNGCSLANSSPIKIIGIPGNRKFKTAAARCASTVVS